MIIVWGSVPTTTAHRDQLLAECHTHVARSREEPGCIEHGAYIDSEDPNRIVFFERWTDAAALKAHFAVPGSQQFVQTLRELAAAEPEMHIYTASEGME
ncbi:MAG: putative quinol monooxygenase [Pseudomonadota bacterium]